MAASRRRAVWRAGAGAGSRAAGTARCRTGTGPGLEQRRSPRLRSGCRIGQCLARCRPARPAEIHRQPADRAPGGGSRRGPAGTRAGRHAADRCRARAAGPCDPRGRTAGRGRGVGAGGARHAARRVARQRAAPLRRRLPSPAPARVPGCLPRRGSRAGRVRLGDRRDGAGDRCDRPRRRPRGQRADRTPARHQPAAALRGARGAREACRRRKRWHGCARPSPKR